jgi:ankyrin repeat protein
MARKDGTTPLMIAAANGHHKLVDLLIKFQPDKLAARKEDGSTALHLASSKGHVEVSNRER